MTTAQPGQNPENDPRSVELTAHALGDLSPAEADAVSASLAGDPVAKRTCAETKVIASDLRDAYEAASLPAASAELRASLDRYLIPANSEDHAVTKAPDIIPPARRRFTPLEIILSIAVVCLISLVVLMNARPNSLHEVADVSQSISNLDSSHPSGSGTKSPIVDNSESMTETRTPLGSTYLEEYSVTAEPLASDPDPYSTAASSGGGQGQGEGQRGTASPKPTTISGPTSYRADDNSYYALGKRYSGVANGGDSGVVNGRVLAGLDPADGEVRLWEDGIAVDHPIGDLEKGEKDKEAREGGRSGDQYARIYENAFKTVSQDPLSTFSIDVDTASYSKLRQHILEYGQLPPPDAIRIEELINYFPYDYLEPMDEHPFAAHMEVAQCPWKAEHRLARIAIKGKEMKPDARPASNLVFLIDVSGSMNEANKLPLVIRGLEMLTRELNKNDRVAIVVYAGAAGLVLPSTSGEEKETILAALGKLAAGGSTAGAEGINLAYKTAEENFIHAGVNRVILCSDGDFNVGVSDTGSLVRLAEEQAKKNIFLSILGFGIGNLNDEMLEQVSDKANGMYAFIDTENEARKVLVEQMSGTLVTIAKDVKIQIEFNPAKVAAYRLIGYENRILAAEDFNNDKKDAGEIGAGHTVTALYEIVPVVAKEKPEIPAVDELKYQRPSELTDAAESDELLTLKLRYKSPEGDKSTLLSEPIDDSTEAFGKVSDDFKFAAAVASFGMLLRGSEYSGDATMDAVLEIATDGAKHDEWGYRKEFLEIVKRAKEIAK